MKKDRKTERTVSLLAAPGASLVVAAACILLGAGGQLAYAQNCGTCDGTTLLVDKNVTVNFNPSIPTCDDGHGGAGLCAFFTADKSGGATPDKWKAVFDVLAQKLEVTTGATITTTPVPASGNNRAAPGIDIKGTCQLLVDEGDGVTAAGAIVVSSVNRRAGAINLTFDGGVTINGKVLDQVTGTNGNPGDININTTCGDIVTGPTSQILTIGQDHGGSNISLTSCTGNIAINGLVDASYKAAPASTINVNAPAGSVTIDGNNLIGTEPGTGRKVTSGVTVRSRRDPVAGFINIQAGSDITVLGNRILTTNPATRNYGAVAIKSGGTNGTSGNGAMVVVSLAGGINASDRAFDFANRFNALNDITLFAKLDIDLSVTAAKNAGAADNTKAVVSTQGGSAGKGGTNTLRSYSGGINIGTNAQVLADFSGSPGSNGTNLLTSCTGVTNNGTVSPADAVPGDDIGVCAPAAPDSILPLCTTVIASCLPTSSLSVLIQPPNVLAYVPKGSWSFGTSGVKVAPVEGAGPFTTIATPNIVNSCSSNSGTGETVCTANGLDVYLITGSSLNTTLASGATGSMGFSGGSCMTCGVAIDSGTNQAVLAIGLAPGGTGGFQFLDLGTNTFGAPIPVGGITSENISLDPIRHLVLSPNEANVYQIFNSQTGVLFNNPVSTNGELDAGAEDCSTGIALSTIEFTNDLYIADLTQAIFTPGSPGTWSAVGASQVQTFPEFSGLGAGTSGIAVAPGSHLGIVTGEFGGNKFGVIQLPSTSGSGLPAVVDWVATFVPNDASCGGAFSIGFDPHTVTAYTSPNTGKAIGVMANDVVSCLAVVDLQALLSAPLRVGHDLAVGDIPAGAVTFVALP